MTILKIIFFLVHRILYMSTNFKLSTVLTNIYEHAFITCFHPLAEKHKYSQDTVDTVDTVDIV